MKSAIRYPAVAESFYPSDSAELEKTVTNLLDDAPAPPAALSDRTIRAIMVPHAGYSFSGKVAASAYRLLRGKSFDTVYLLGNAHAYIFDGVALDGHETWQSPLGKVLLNSTAAQKLQHMAPGLVTVLNIAHHSDHTLEVHIPFLQCTLKPGFRILPLLFGENPPDIYRKAAELLKETLGPEDLLVASTDLSHYPSYDDACGIDRKTLEHITAMDIEGLDRHVRKTMKRNIPHEDALFCGPDGLRTVLETAGRSGWQSREILYSNSGDAMFHDRDAVVGYGAVVFHDR